MHRFLIFFLCLGVNFAQAEVLDRPRVEDASLESNRSATDANEKSKDGDLINPVEKNDSESVGAEEIRPEPDTVNIEGNKSRESKSRELSLFHWSVIFLIIFAFVAGVVVGRWKPQKKIDNRRIPIQQTEYTASKLLAQHNESPHHGCVDSMDDRNQLKRELQESIENLQKLKRTSERVKHDLEFSLEKMTAQCKNLEDSLDVQRNELQDSKRKAAKFEGDYESLHRLHDDLSQDFNNLKSKLSALEIDYTGKLVEAERLLSLERERFNKLELTNQTLESRVFALRQLKWDLIPEISEELFDSVESITDKKANSRVDLLRELVALKQLSDLDVGETAKWAQSVRSFGEKLFSLNVSQELVSAWAKACSDISGGRIYCRTPSIGARLAPWMDAPPGISSVGSVARWAVFDAAKDQVIVKALVT